MAVMRHLTVDGTTYDTVGEASVTQVQTSGTKIATVSIDGTSTDIYAPSGGSTVEPATATPIVDGTAAVGSSAKYAREDHVHPTDTSRAAASHSHAIGDLPTGTSSTTVALGNHTHSGYAASSHAHGDITSGGDITATAPTIASGDKLVINDESASKITNGPAFGSSTTTFLRNDGTWAEPSSGGLSMNTTTCTLPTSGWSSDAITVNCSGVTASNDVIVAPAPASASAYAAAGIVCTAQGAGTLTFTRTSANSASITVNVMIFSGGGLIVAYSITNLDPFSYATIDKTAAQEGETVTVTSNGYSSYFELYRTTDYPGGSPYYVGYYSNGVGTFTMPAFDVSVYPKSGPE